MHPFALFLLLVSMISSVSFAMPLATPAMSVHALNLVRDTSDIGTKPTQEGTGNEEGEPSDVHTQAFHYLELYEHPEYAGNLVSVDFTDDWGKCKWVDTNRLLVSSIKLYSYEPFHYMCWAFTEYGCPFKSGKRLRITRNMRDLAKVLGGQFSDNIKSFSCYKQSGRGKHEPDPEDMLPGP